MDAYRMIVTKRDTRQFTKEPVSEEVLGRVLQAGRMAGSAKNMQLTRMVVVTGADTKTKLASCGDFTTWIPGGAAIIVFAIPVDGGRLFDVGRMAQNVMLAAHHEGLGSCPVTFQHQDRMRETIGLPAEMEGPMGVVLGHKGDGPGRMRAPRLPIEQVVHRESWQG